MDLLLYLSLEVERSLLLERFLEIDLWESQVLFLGGSIITLGSDRVLKSGSHENRSLCLLVEH